MTTPATNHPTRTVSRRRLLASVGTLGVAGSVALAGCLDGDLAGTAANEYRSCESFDLTPGGNYNEADLSRCDLSERGIQAARFQFADLSGANLDGADLYMIDARSATFDGASLRGADLGVAKLREASFRNVDLREADLTGAQLVRVDLTGADLTDADLTRTLFNGATMPDGSTYDADSEVVRTP